MSHELQFSQIEDQYASGHEQPTVLIERSPRGNNAPIQTARLTAEYDHKNRRYVTFDDPNLGESLKPIAAEHLADHYQERLANVLADAALVSAEIEKPLLKLRAEDIESANGRIKNILHSTDGEIQKLIASLGESPSEIRDAIDPNKGDEVVRSQLLLLLERHIDTLGEAGTLPERVQDNFANNLKVADASFNHPERLPSRQYAARIALAMLDGSFNDAKSKSSRYEDLPVDSPHNGQHRQAAEMLLNGLYNQKDQFANMFDPDFDGDIAAAAVQTEEDPAKKARSAADHKYNQVMATTGDHDTAQEAADRVWKNFGFK